MLSGIRVIELSRTLAGPLVGQILGDLGAEVIKIEHPEGGDESRRFSPPEYAGSSCYFQSANRNKSSITLNLKNEQDRASLYRLVESADVVTESFRGGVPEKLGVDFGTLKGYNPNLIYLSVSGYGRTGSRANWPAYDIIMQAETGLMSITGTRSGEQVKIGPSIADMSTGLYGTIGVIAALFERKNSNQGQYLDIAMFDTQFSLMANWVLATLGTGQAPAPMGTGNPALAPYQTVKTTDGSYMVGVANDGLWQSFCKGLGIEQLLNNPLYRTNQERVANRDQLIADIEELTQTMSMDELDARMKTAGVPGSKVNNLKDVINSEFAAERQILVPTEGDPDVSPYTVKFPVSFSRTPVSKYTRAPGLGGTPIQQVIDDEEN